jgi:hypothetical protein
MIVIFSYITKWKKKIPNSKNPAFLQGFFSFFFSPPEFCDIKKLKKFQKLEKNSQFYTTRK